MRLLIAIHTVLIFVIPAICMGSTGKVCRDLLSQGKHRMHELHDMVCHIPLSTWYYVILPFLLGASAIFFLWKFSKLQKVLTFVHVLEHEIMHGIACILCGGRLNSITVGLNGGLANVTKGNIIVNLAPYCLPLLCTTTLLLIGLMKPGLKIYGLAFAGLLYGNFLRGAFSSLGIQTDIKVSGGKLISYPIIFSANMIIVCSIGICLIKMR